MIQTPIGPLIGKCKVPLLITLLLHSSGTQGNKGKKEIKKLKEEVRKLSDNSEIQASTISTLLKKNNELQEQLDAEVKIREETDKIYYGAFEDYDESISNLFSNYTSMEARIVQIVREQNKMTGQLENLSVKNDNQDLDLTKLNTDFDTLNSGVTNIVKDYGALKNEVSVFGDDVEKLVKDNDDLDILQKALNLRLSEAEETTRANHEFSEGLDLRVSANQQILTENKMDISSTHFTK